MMRLLADRAIMSTLHTGWSPAPAAPNPRVAPEFGVFYRAEAPSAGWDVSNPVWGDRDIIIYRAR